MRHACITAGRYLLILAMTLAIGGHWAVLQSVAWTTMVVARAQNENLGDALKNTFDGNHPCELCKSIEKARQSEKKQDPQILPVKKVDLLYQQSAVALRPPVHFRELRFGDAFAGVIPREPILQPPREALA